jgi:hypothetical protein
MSRRRRDALPLGYTPIKSNGEDATWECPAEGGMPHHLATRRCFFESESIQLIGRDNLFHFNNLPERPAKSAGTIVWQRLDFLTAGPPILTQGRNARRHSIHRKKESPTFGKLGSKDTEKTTASQSIFRKLRA